MKNADNHIVVYEHDKLMLSQDFIDEKELKQLWTLNDEVNGEYFTNLHNGIKFSQYVGVIQIGKKTIEVLPKADRSEEDDPKLWQNVLIEMLRVSRNLSVQSISDANLKHRPSRLLELYFNLFISEVEAIERRGLVKAYRKQQGNVKALKGSILFSEHINKNLIHKERFYTKHQVYDQKHVLHRILKKALEVIASMPSGMIYSERINRLLLALPDQNTSDVSKDTFNSLVLNRKTEHYNKAIDLARLIILNYSPDIKSGREHMMAILFDMNNLWEDYVYRMLKKAAPSGWEVQGQESKSFWRGVNLSVNKKVRPDIVLKYSEKTYVIDTKWKLPKNNRPSDDDLKQIYVYNLLWGAKKSVLLYPSPSNRSMKDVSGSYNKGLIAHEFDHSCDLRFLDIIDKETKKLNSIVVQGVFKWLV